MLHPSRRVDNNLIMSKKLPLCHSDGCAMGIVPYARNRNFAYGGVTPPRRKTHFRVGRDFFIGRASCCGAQNLYAALTAASNFDRGHSFLLTVSATGGARKRPRLQSSILQTTASNLPTISTR